MFRRVSLVVALLVLVLGLAGCGESKTRVVPVTPTAGTAGDDGRDGAAAPSATRPPRAIATH
jgi:hypothetical protein